MKLKKGLVVALFGIVAFLSGCASVSKQATNVHPEPKPDQALVYFYREKKLMGAAVSYNIKQGEKVIGGIANGTYFFAFVEPGEHTFVASTEASSRRTLTVEAGRTYYIECGIEMGLVTGRPSLKVQHDAEAKAVLPMLTYAIK